uniref:Uncharacterized protein TCIL3000_10_2250 n=1 Tax=Trypanosoma congolense (strain IL3000) TaxID=1068625 RepID=G0UVQ0_TRYCI|nr:unnamed protein product [Trypanosoma congolense IL3000]
MMGFFSKKPPAFSAGKLKANLRMAVTRVRMQQTKLVNGIKVKRRQLAELLALEKYESARVRVEQVLREDVSIEGYEVLALFLDLLCNRLHLISEGPDGRAEHKNGLEQCPPELKECVTSVLWAAARVGSTVPELQSISKCFELKFGAGFVSMSVGNSEFSVNQKIIDRLGVVTPSNEHCVEYLTNVAKEYGIENYDELKLRNPEGLVVTAPATTGEPMMVVPTMNTATLERMVDSADSVRTMTKTPSGMLIPALVEPRDELEYRLLQLKRG